MAQDTHNLPPAGLSIQIVISEKLYLKNPQSTELGKRIIRSSIAFISAHGFETFTFKKLAEEIHSTEASVYRYFENKHKLLVYLISWYWTWLSYRLNLELFRLENPLEKLKRAIRVFCHTAGPFPLPAPLDLEALYVIVINESPKAYLTHEVDEDNKEGAFLSYKRFCMQIASLVQEIKPSYPHPTSLISTAVESAHHQKYFSEHLPSLTEVSKGNKEEITEFLEDMILKTICG